MQLNGNGKDIIGKVYVLGIRVWSKNMEEAIGGMATNNSSASLSGSTGQDLCKIVVVEDIAHRDGFLLHANKLL